MYQAWTMHTFAFEQPVGAIVGTWYCDELSEVDQSGIIRNVDVSIPWLRQFHKDMRMLEWIDGGHEFFQELDGRHGLLFVSLELAQAYDALSIAQSRASTY